ncbi:MAG: lysylphosphatidylglycerol synthase transmembrane domain-containing protein [Planctomycetia bacterium]|nr:lysylphosphatidylglycerol synthase transmembrane domain-containing protein [Planctomycetia bacterium]
MSEPVLLPGRSSGIRRWCVLWFQLTLSAVILGYLAVQAYRSGAFTELAQREKQWSWLVVGALVSVTGILGTFFRWYRLLRSQRLEVSWRDTFRFSAVGYVVNFAPLGIAGGDFLKAVLIARHQRHQRATAITSVLIDRVVGLAALFYVITLLAFLTGSVRFPVPIDEFREVLALSRAGSPAPVPGELFFQLLVWIAILMTILGTVAMVLVIWPKYTGGRYLLAWIARLPKIGPKLDAILRSFEAFGRTPLILLESIALAMLFHGLFGLGAWCMAMGLFREVHGVSRMALLFSLANSSQIIPLPLGPTELVLDLLCRWVPIAVGGKVAMKIGEGAVIAIACRAANLLTASGFVPCWFLSRREVRRVQEMLRDERTPPQ